MFSVEASEVVDASPEEVLELVMDLDRYRAADHKIRRIRWIERDGNIAVVSFWSRFRGLVVPATQRMALTPGDRIDVRNVESWMDRLVHFEGSFECEPVPGGTRVTHRYLFDFAGALGRVAEPLMRDWLDRDIHQEVARIRDIFQRLVQPSC